MRLFSALSACLALVTLAACQSSQDKASAGGAASFCDRLIGWKAVDGDADTKRAVTRPEMCSLSNPAAIWFKSKQVHSNLRGREYWLLVPPNDPHVQAGALRGWDLQVRPFGYAHEFFIVRNEDARLKPALARADCPRKAVGIEGVKGGKRYCLSN